MPLLRCLSRRWSHSQGNLFPGLTEELGPLPETHKQVMVALEVADVEAFVQVWPGLPGRPPSHVLIDENLCRHELSPAERSIAVTRRKAIYVQLHPRTAHGGNQ